MDIRLDTRHIMRGRTLICHVSSRDIKLGSHVTVNRDALLSNYEKLDKVVFKFDDGALALLAKENHIEPAGELTFFADSDKLPSIATTQDLSGVIYCLIPLYWLQGFVETAEEEEPHNPKKSLFD